MRAGERGAVGVAGALGCLGCLEAFSFFWVSVGVVMVGSEGAEALVLAWTFCSMLAFRAGVVSLLGSSVGFVLPTTRGLSWPPDVDLSPAVSEVVEGAILGWKLFEKLLPGAWK